MSVITTIKQADLASRIKDFTHKDFEIFDKLLQESLNASELLVTEVASHIIFSGGKRIRPLLTIICSKMLGGSSTENFHINLAVAVELIHTATLLHDDVVDEGDVRRGSITAHNKWGSKASILVGDFLFSQAFKLMALTGCARTLTILSSASVKIAEGEVKQLVKSNSTSLSIEDYFEVISGKTAELFGASTAVAASIADRDEIVETKLRDFGFYLGILFQIIDDYIDYFGATAIIGKKTGADFFAGKVTLPFIILLNKLPIEEKQKLILLFHKRDKDQADFNYIISLMKQVRIEEDLQVFIDNYHQEALDAISYFSDCDAKEILVKILEFSKSRNY